MIRVWQNIYKTLSAKTLISMYYVSSPANQGTQADLAIF